MAVLFAAIGFALGGLLKGATGAGAPIIAVPIIAMFYDVRLAVTVFAMPNLLANVWQAWSYRQHRLPGRFPLAFSIAGGVGAGLGTVLLANLPGTALTLVVAIATLAYIAFRFLRPAWVLPFKLAERLAVPAGTLAGMLQGAAGISAPVSITFLNAMRLERPQFIVTISAFFTTIGIVQIPMLVAYGFMTWKLFAVSVAALMPILAFMPVGSWLAQRLSREVFDRLVLVVLAAIAVRLILQAVL